MAAKRTPVEFELVDRYLLGDAVSKPDVVAAVLAHRSSESAALPFYRALEAVGVRAADEAFIALRLVLAGKAPADDAVRRLRAFAAVAHACARADAASLGRTFKRDGALLAALPAPPALGAAEADFAALGQRARNAYFDELRA
jgi:hypothetical protein